MTGRKIRYGLASLASELIASCIFLIVVNVRTGTPPNPSKTLESVGIVVLVGPILADTDDAMVVVLVVVEGGR